MSVAEADIDAWYADIVVKTLRDKEEVLSRARTRFQLAVALMDSVRMDVRDARKDVRKWQKKAAVGRIHCPRLKARMSVPASATAPTSVSAPTGEDSDEESAQSSSSSSSSSQSMPAAQSHSESSQSTLVAVESAQSPLVAEESSQSTLVVEESAQCSVSDDELFAELTSGWEEEFRRSAVRLPL